MDYYVEKWKNFTKKILGFLTALNKFILKLAYPVEIVALKCKIWFLDAIASLELGYESQ